MSYHDFRLLVGITGSIGVVTIPGYLIALKNAFPSLQVIMSDSAQKFIPKDTMLLFSKDIHTDLFESSKEGMNHIYLAKWADLFIVLPATANILAQTAHGLAGTFLSTVILAHEKPILFFPNMNRCMWDNPVTQRNVVQLKADGHKIITSQEGIGYEYASGDAVIEENIPTVEMTINIIEEELKSRNLSTHYSASLG